MRKQRLTLDNTLDAMISMNMYSEGDSNHKEREKMKKLINMALYREVTEKQRYCITEHFINNKAVKEIANELSVNSSTVSRHIQRGLKNIKKVSDYITI